MLLEKGKAKFDWKPKKGSFKKIQEGVLRKQGLNEAVNSGILDMAKKMSNEWNDQNLSDEKARFKWYASNGFKKGARPDRTRLSNRTFPVATVWYHPALACHISHNMYGDVYFADMKANEQISVDRNGKIKSPSKTFVTSDNPAEDYRYRIYTKKKQTAPRFTISGAEKPALAGFEGGGYYMYYYNTHESSATTKWRRQQLNK